MVSTKYLLLVIFITFGILFSCTNQDTVFFSQNLFPNTQNLTVQYVGSDLGLPVFDISETSAEALYIAIFEEVPLVENQQIVNTGAKIWHWHSGLKSLSRVSFQDGVISNAAYELEGIYCLKGQELYWAAWTWDGTRVNASTPLTAINFQPRSPSKVQLQKVEFAANKDGLFTAGETLEMTLFLESTGTQQAKDIYVELSHPLVIGLPQTKVIEQMNSGAVLPVKFDFTLPNDIPFRDSLHLSIHISHGQCVEEPIQTYTLIIDGKQLYLKRVKLQKIFTSPAAPWIDWDPLFASPYSNPDPYFLLITNVTDTLYRSNPLENTDAKNPNAAWAILNPALPLQLDKEYAIQVLDRDTPFYGIESGEDDFIGDILLSPKTWLEDLNSREIITSSSIMLELDLVWE